MKTKLIYLLLVTLLITNLVMLFMLVNKPHQRQRGGLKPKKFLIEKLHLSDEQKEIFLVLDKEHRSKLHFYNAEIRKLKEYMFAEFSNSTEIDHDISEKMGDLLAKKEEEIFYFFNNLKSICDNEEQLKSLENIIKKGIMRQEDGGRPHDMPPPPPRGNHNLGPKPPPR